jgi:pyrimidine operon attenuation protein / uracil phosphoribosyltransferase
MTALPDPNELATKLADAAAPSLTKDSVIIGIHTGGVWVAEVIAQRLKQMHGLALAFGELAVTFHRDDYNRIGLKQHGAHGKSSMQGIQVEGRDVLLVDDVLYTGRTTRAAMNEIFDFGRPARVRLACLLDRGGRELPIQPDFCGAVMPLAPTQAFELSRYADGGLKLQLHS